jgi:formylglycine-generating enzyme required for sulfatase activity
MEYRYWVAKIYGDSSAEHLATAPRQEVWMDHPVEKAKRGMVSYYYASPAYRDYPVVGITLEQAKSYCKWRSDRVAEFILIREGLIEVKPEQTREMHFTVERYFAGQYYDYTAPEKSLVMPEYALPTKEEWEQFASAGLSTDTFPRGVNLQAKSEQKYLGNYTYLFNDNTYCDTFKPDTAALMPQPVYGFIPNNFKLYQTSGNIAEMVQEPGIAKGGSWFHSPDSCTVDVDLPYDTPKMWLGFRCVCTLYLPS